MADQSQDEVSSRVSARIGLLGNPSDSCAGCCIAVAIENFAATVKVEAASGIHFEPNAKHDPSSFDDLDALSTHADRHGYYGGQRLLMATCKLFQQECSRRGLPLVERGFRMSYDTTIPRQSGLSGSSAIICAAFNCLLRWYGVGERWPVVERPTFVLAVEQQELGITAGLMDRVAQVYGGAVYMDLQKEAMSDGHGRYEYLPAEKLPNLWVVYANNPSDSGGVHAPVKQRWLDGDAEVCEGMRDLAGLAKMGRERLQQAEDRLSASELAPLMDQNFAIRRRLYGDAALGALNLDMIATAKLAGAAAKFCGSGGAIVCCPAGEDEVSKLIELCLEKSFICEKVAVAPPYFDSV